MKKRDQTRPRKVGASPKASASVPRHVKAWFPIVGVGASAGGLEAFSDLLRHLPEKIGMAFVLVQQHLDPSHGNMLREILSRTTQMPVDEVADGTIVEPDHIYVIPANRQTEIRRNTLHLSARPPELAVEDVTEQRKHLEAITRQAALLELAHDAVIVRGLEGEIRFWNRGAEELYGWTREEAVGKNKQQLLQPKFLKSWRELEAELLKNGRWEGEVTHVRRDGSRCTVLTRWALQPGADSPVVLEINRDITAQKRDQQNLQHLSAYLIRLQDEERRRIARELHDSTGQKLILLKMSLESLGKQLDPNPQAEMKLAESMKLADEATQEIRTLAQILHPPLLDEAGLAVAAKMLVEGFSRTSGIALDFHAPENLARLPENMEIALFRVMQEALNNIHRHSGATKAEITITEAPQGVTLMISDNGAGFRQQPHGDRSAGSSPLVGVGIQGMKERLAQLGGTLEITSGKKGTTIIAKAPHHPSEAS